MSTTYTPKHLDPTAKPVKARRKHSIAGDILYYTVLVLFVLGVFLLRGAGGGAPARVLGFSAMRVLTGSMGDDLPVGSLIITQAVAPEDLKIGDDITFLVGENTPVTHRVVAVTEEDGGLRFTTKGTANDSPDRQSVPPENIVGRVIFHSLMLGVALGYLREHWLLVLIFGALFLGLIKALQVFIREGKKSPQG